jgi:hypothetical protein
MMAHELLRQAALILGAGWSKGSNARDSAGRIVPLHVGATLYVGVSVPRHRGEDGQMMAHELLRQAALILAAGWSKGADARDVALSHVAPPRRH